MSSTKITLISIAAVSLLAHGGVRTFNEISYDQQVEGHLKLAADANSTELAEQKLKIAIEGMDARGICKKGDDNCFTSIIYRTPDEDVGFWRKNVEGTLAGIQAMTPEERADNLTESNQLMKIRETLLDSGQHGDHVTSPAGIAVYGYNRAFALWVTVSILAFGMALLIPERRRDW